MWAVGAGGIVKFASVCVLLALLWRAPASGQASAVDQAVELAGQGQAQRAEQMFLALEKAHPDSAEIPYKFGLVLLRQGQVEQARRRLERAAQLEPQSPLVWLAAGQARLRTGDLPGAAEAVKQAQVKAAGEPAVLEAIARFHHQLGRAFAEQKQPAEAVHHWQEAIALAPEQAVLYADLAGLLLEHRTPEPAEAILAEAVKRLPDDPELRRLLGVAQYAQGRNQEAIGSFLQAIAIDPDMEAAYASLETLLPEAGRRLQEIREKLLGFAKRHPESPVGPYLLALSLPEDLEDREPLLRRAIQVAPDFWPAHFELHKILKAEGNWREAREALEKTVQLNPGYAPAHYGLAEVYARLGDRERARQQREIHHKLMREQQAERERQREQAPRLPYRLSER
jgi:tetratricopeptide (TPR) repeat protein